MAHVQVYFYLSWLIPGGECLVNKGLQPYISLVLITFCLLSWRNQE